MPRKGENIYKRKDGRWEGRYIRSKSQNGKSIYGYVYASSYRDVKQKLKDKKLESVNNIDSKKYKEDSIAITISQLSEEWLKNLQVQIKESSYAKYRNLIRSYIIPYCGNQKVYSLTADDLLSFSTELLAHGGKAGQGLSAKSVADTLSIMRNLLKYAERKGIHTKCSGKEITVRQKSSKLVVLSTMDQAILTAFICNNLTERNLGIIICLFTGLRVGEVCALRWEDISFSEKTLYVHHTVQRIQNSDHVKPKTRVVITTPKSSCSIRTIPLTDELVSLMKSSSVVHEHGYILTGCDTKITEPRIMENHFKKILEKCNLTPINFHALRHTFATRCIEAGFDVKSLSEILGHASVSITMNRYVHPSMELKRDNMQKLACLLAVR